MKFIHVADAHASRERLPQILSIFETLIERCKKGDIAFILFSGDFWDSTITATKGSGFSDILDAKRRLEKYVYLYFVYGTPSHEPNGSLDAFKSDKTFVYNKMNAVSVNVVSDDMTRLIVIPEPRRSEYISNSSAETDELINNAIKDFIKGIKPESAYKHTVVMYHGEVKGAVYQNGVSASSPTAISKKLLQSLNADYYALGHIHMPQEVFHNAWYSGSACPKNFGETHDGCYNLVTIEDGKTTVERVSFGLPIYETYRVNYPFEEPHGDWSNYHIRLQFDCTKEQKKSLNIKQLADEIKAKTNALSVKLEPTVIETETTERSEVCKHKSIVEKMDEYVKEKALIMPRYSKELLQEIEDNTLAKLAYPQHSFELLSISLRGAIGIRDGQHKEEIEINFEQYEDGVICLVGPTGHGKSTCLENCHPYPQMLTRDGTLKEHFYLKDSHRILLYKDENGLYYKISMLIDGKTATGKASYYVETSKDRESWNSVPDIDGSLETYKKWVNSTFGSIDVFLRTAFFAKEPTKDATDISDTTKSQRMELLSKLAGTEHLKEVASIAKDKRKELEKAADKIETEIESYSRYEQNIKDNKEDIKTWKNQLKGQEKTVTDLEGMLSELKVKDDEYQKVKAVAEANSALYDEYNAKLRQVNSQLESYETALKHYGVVEKLRENKETVVSNTKKIVEKQKEISKLHKEIDKLSEELSLKQKEYNSNVSKYNQVKAELRVVESQIVPVEETCPTCGGKLSNDKIKELTSVVKENEKKRNNLKEQLSKYNTDEETWNWILKPLESKINEHKKSIKFLEAAIDSLTEENEVCEAFEIMNPNFQEFTALSEEDIKNCIETMNSEIGELNSKMGEIVDSATLEDVSEQLEETETKLKREQNILAELKANINAAEKENKRYEKELESVVDKKEQIQEFKEKVTAYLFIEDAFSNNGIPAIELRESAPEIAEITNKILEDSYGSKFEIHFGSTSEVRTKRKADEDFNIIVYDTENGDEKTIDLVSSGERIWIKQALFYAFSIVQMNRTGFNFRTRLIDESDGSLDGGLRPKYLRMVEAAHRQADSRITILITHSQEIKDIAQQIIEI